MKKKNLAFTLAEVLIVIGIIGVVAALTLPNLNHATGDKETVTRLQKAYSILNEANDRAVAIYGPISTWVSNHECQDYPNACWLKRVSEFLKISKSCDENAEPSISCDNLHSGDMDYNTIILQLADGITISSDGDALNIVGGHVCDLGPYALIGDINDICFDHVRVDINGPTKGKNKAGNDIFQFIISDSLGVLPLSYVEAENTQDALNFCLRYNDVECTFWPIEYGNLDYLKTDSSGKCNDSNIILDGTTNTSCH